MTNVRTTINPPLHTWTPRASDDPARLAVLHAARNPLTGAAITPQTPRTIVATGHQASLWHPGILAKYIALRTAASRHGAAALNVVVDHDVYDPLQLDVPIVRDDVLAVRRVSMPSIDARVPPRMQPPVEGQRVIDALDRFKAKHGSAVAVDLSVLADAWRDLPTCDHLAEQMTVVLARLMEPHVGVVPTICATKLMELGPAQAIIDRMLADVRECVRAYNAATAVAPRAGVRQLHDGVDLVEVPLWLIHKQGRLPVFAEMHASRCSHLFTDRGPIEAGLARGDGLLAPRALMLTAMMRSIGCDLFIHGTGGGVYDRITDAWIEQWLGEPLAPMAVATADVHLRFDVPIANRGQVARAVWYAHHLPHNLDRALSLDGALVAQKRDLLAAMDQDRDSRRRARAFDRLHEINAQLAAQYAQAVAAAAQAADQARAGLLNSHLTRRRDWCFALYPPSDLADLVKEIERQSTGPVA